MVKLKVTQQMCIAEVEMLEDILDWGGGTVWRHGDQLVCYESGKNWEAWEKQTFSGGVRKEGTNMRLRMQKLQVPVP